MLIDSHVHLLDPRLRDRAEEIINNLKQDGLEFVVEISSDSVESRESVQFAMANNSVYCAIGVHPMFADAYSNDFEKWAEDVVVKNKNKKIVAIGECGLDYYHLTCSKDIQRDTFIRQIKLADRLGLPLVVHSRDAFDDTFEILQSHRKHLKNGILMHCFSGGANEVERFKSLNMYFAFGGAITYKNSDLAESAIRVVPLDRLLIETDCPYLTPVPFRGQINEPKNVKIVAEQIAKVLGLTFEEVGKLTTENAKRFYRINKISI